MLYDDEEEESRVDLAARMDSILYAGYGKAIDVDVPFTLHSKVLSALQCYSDKRKLVITLVLSGR